MAKLKKELLCGCIVAVGYDDSVKVVYCPKHKAAPDMYEALKETEEIFSALYRVGSPQYGVIPLYTERHIKVKQALSKAEGKPAGTCPEGK